MLRVRVRVRVCASRHQPAALAPPPQPAHPALARLSQLPHALRCAPPFPAMLLCLQLERVVELRLCGQPPLRLQRLLIRHRDVPPAAQRPPTRPIPVVGVPLSVSDLGSHALSSRDPPHATRHQPGALAATAVPDQAAAPPHAGALPTAAAAAAAAAFPVEVRAAWLRAARARRSRPVRRVYRHQLLEVAVRALTTAVSRGLCAMARAAVAAPWAALPVLVLGSLDLLAAVWSHSLEGDASPMELQLVLVRTCVPASARVLASADANELKGAAVPLAGPPLPRPLQDVQQAAPTTPGLLRPSQAVCPCDAHDPSTLWQVSGAAVLLTIHAIVMVTALVAVCTRCIAGRRRSAGAR